jgi:hypothetical protein
MTRTWSTTHHVRVQHPSHPLPRAGCSLQRIIGINAKLVVYYHAQTKSEGGRVGWGEQCACWWRRRARYECGRTLIDIYWSGTAREESWHILSINSRFYRSSQAIVTKQDPKSAGINDCLRTAYLSNTFHLEILAGTPGAPYYSETISYNPLGCQ